MERGQTTLNSFLRVAINATSNVSFFGLHMHAGGAPLEVYRTCYCVRVNVCSAGLN